MRLVLVNRSFGCRTSAARTRDLIHDTFSSFTAIYNLYVSILADFNPFFLDVLPFLSVFGVLWRS